MVKGFDYWIVLGSYKGSHVEGRADGRPSSPHRALASKCTAVSIQWGNTNQSCHLASVQATQFRQMGQ